MDLTVLIPTLNEGPNLCRLLPELTTALDEINVTYEVLIVDNNSQDGTEKIVGDAGAHYILDERPGYGLALARGISEAQGEFVLTMDADLSHPTDVVKDLWAVREAADITIASRYVPGGNAEQSFFRSMLSKILNGLFRKGLDVDVRDMSSGYRLYRKGIFSQIEIEFTNFVALMDILMRAHGSGFIIQEIPFHYKPRASGSSKARIIRFGLDYLRLFCKWWVRK